MQNASGKIALVTGANKGIGFEIAGRIARAGATVLLGARNESAGAASAAVLADAGLAVKYIAIDVTDRDSIAAAASAIAADVGRLDILVNNAGISAAASGDGRPSVASYDAVERVLRTNFMGALAVSQAVLPLLRKARAGRIVNVSSGLGSLTQMSDPTGAFSDIQLIGYSASKAALNMLTVRLAHELRDTTITVHSVDPGYTATDLNGRRGHQSIAEGAAEAIRVALGHGVPTGTFTDRNGAVAW